MEKVGVSCGQDPSAAHSPLHSVLVRVQAQQSGLIPILSPLILFLAVT